MAPVGARKPSVATLPSRAHPQDYGRRTTPSNYITHINSVRGLFARYSPNENTQLRILRRAQLKRTNYSESGLYDEIDE